MESVRPFIRLTIVNASYVLADAKPKDPAADPTDPTSCAVFPQVRFAGRDVTTTVSFGGGGVGFGLLFGGTGVGLWLLDDAFEPLDLGFVPITPTQQEN